MNHQRRTIAFLAIAGLVVPLGATVAPASGSDASRTSTIAASAVTATTMDADTIAARKRKCRKGKVALTFDDGPQPSDTRKLLNVLRRNQVRATFFVQGYRARAYPKLVRRIKRAGHRVGNHTWNHPDLTKLSKGQIRSQIVRANRAITQAGAPRPTLMRPPYGATDNQVDAVVRRLHMHEVLWSVDTQNWSGISVDAIVRRALAAIHRGDNIILMHDGVSTSNRTVKAVPRVIRGIRKRGYCVAPLTRRGEPRKPYHRIKPKHWSTKGSAR